jgi:hypothetical protein
MADGVRSRDPLNGPVSTQVVVLASALRGRAPELAGQLAGRIIKQIDFYAERARSPGKTCMSHAGTTSSSCSGTWGISVRVICRHRGGQAGAVRPPC